MLGIIFGWFIFAIVAWIIASSRGRFGFGYFLLSLILSPLVGIILAAALPSKKPLTLASADGEIASPNTHVRCPDCRELVRADARKCKHCGVALVPQELDAVKSASVQNEKAAAPDTFLEFCREYKGFLIGLGVLAIIGIVSKL